MPIHCVATSIAALPWWLVDLGLGLFAFAAALLFQSVGGYLILRRLRAEQPQHWAERARLAFPYATFSTIHPTMVGTGWLVAGVPLWKNLWAPLPLAAAAALGSLVRSRPTWRHLRELSLGARERERGAWIPLPLLNAIFILLPILVVVSIAGKSASQAWLAIAALILGMIGYRAWLSIPVARALGMLLFRPAPESLQNRIDKVAREGAIGPPGAYLIGSETANAFALPTCYSIAFTGDAL